MFKTFQKLQSEFWLIMAVQQAYSTTEVIKGPDHSGARLDSFGAFLGLR